MSKKENEQGKSAQKKETTKEIKKEKPQTTVFVTRLQKPIDTEQRDKK